MSNGHSCGSRSISTKSGLSRCGDRLIHGIVVDAAEIHDVQQAGAVLGEHVADRRPLWSRVDHLRAQPAGKRLRRVLLEEELLLDAVGIPLERERPVEEVRQDQVRDGVVVVEHVALGDAVVRVIQLVQVGELQRVAADLGGRLPSRSRAAGTLRCELGRAARGATSRRGDVVAQAQEHRARAGGCPASSSRTSPARPAPASPMSCRGRAWGAPRTGTFVTSGLSFA